MGELWGVFREYLWENWLRYNCKTLYQQYDDDNPDDHILMDT